MTNKTDKIQIDIVTILVQLGMSTDIVRKIKQDQTLNR